MSIASMRGRVSQKEILAVSGISRQSYHKHFKHREADVSREELILSEVKEARKTMAYRKMGARPLYYALEIRGMGINQFERLLSANGLSVEIKRSPAKTTRGQPHFQDINLVKNTGINDKNQVISGDITYLPVNGRFYYISTLKDAYSKAVIGLYGGDTLEAVHTVKCLKQAIRYRGGAANLKGCIHHSDGGSQYKSHLYRNTAKYLRWSIAANCLENGMAEQLNFILKNHYLEEEKVTNVNQLNRLLKKVKKIINEKRPVEQLGYRTPVEFEEYIKGVPVNERPVFVFKDPDKRGKGDFERGINVKESSIEPTKKQ